MERMTEQIAEMFKQLEDAEILAKREFEEIDSQYQEMVSAREKAYCRWQDARQAFNLIDSLQELIEKKEETSE